MYPRHPSWPWHNTDTSAPRGEPLEVSDTTEAERESPPPYPPTTAPSPYRAPSLTPTHEMNNLSLPCYLISFLTLYSNYSCMFIFSSCFPFCFLAVWFSTSFIDSLCVCILQKLIGGLENSLL